MLFILIPAMIFIIGSILLIGISMSLRNVVPTNEVHIIQARKTTRSYGTGIDNGNIYYEWPSFLPIIGVSKIVLPVSVFNINFVAYEAYDQGRLPFVVDIVAFFRINDSNLAAQRVSDFNQLHQQLQVIVQGAIRTVLASHDIDNIMVERSKFGEQFTSEVHDQLANWGVIPVKNIELMDIRDSATGKVIHNIMEKKKSFIEMESRSAVAENMKNAEIAEINAKRDAENNKQSALQSIGIRETEKNKEVGLANQAAEQAVREQERITKEKEMAIKRVSEVQQAEIDKSVNILKADQEKQATILLAEGRLESKQRESIAITLEGQARADAEKAMQLAPVQAQIELAKEIGENQGYQQYLITIRQVEANEAVGIEQARALDKADVKIIANTGDPISGVKNVMDIFSSKGGTNIGSMIEGIAQTELGKSVIEKFTNK